MQIFNYFVYNKKVAQIEGLWLQVNWTAVIHSMHWLIVTIAVKLQLENEYSEYL